MKNKGLNWFIYAVTGVLLLVFLNNTIIHKPQDNLNYYETTEDVVEESEVNENRSNDIESTILLGFALCYHNYINLQSLVFGKCKLVLSYLHYNTTPFYILYHSLVVYH